MGDASQLKNGTYPLSPLGHLPIIHPGASIDSKSVLQVWCLHERVVVRPCGLHWRWGRGPPRLCEGASQGDVQVRPGRCPVDVRGDERVIYRFSLSLGRWLGALAATAPVRALCCRIICQTLGPSPAFQPGRQALHHQTLEAGAIFSGWGARGSGGGFGGESMGTSPPSGGGAHLIVAAVEPGSGNSHQSSSGGGAASDCSYGRRQAALSAAEAVRKLERAAAASAAGAAEASSSSGGGSPLPPPVLPRDVAVIGADLASAISELSIFLHSPPKSESELPYVSSLSFIC